MKIDTVLKLDNGTTIDLLSISKTDIYWETLVFELVTYNGVEYRHPLEHHLNHSLYHNVKKEDFWFIHKPNSKEWTEAPNIDINNAIKKQQIKPNIYKDIKLLLSIKSADDDELGEIEIGNLQIAENLTNNELKEFHIFEKSLKEKASDKTKLIFQFKADKIKYLMSEGDNPLNLSME